jgi:prepilin peptidase CpaA
MLSMFLLLALILVASLTDLFRQKIYNWTVYPGILAALGFSMAGAVLLRTTGVSEAQLERLGWIPLGQSLLGLVACGLVMLVCFVVFQVGGGDVKLVAMMGAFLGPEKGIEAMLWTFILGACLGLIVLVWRVGPARLAGRVARQAVWTLRLRWWAPLADAERAQLRQKLYLAPCAALAVLIVGFGLLDRVL